MSIQVDKRARQQVADELGLDVYMLVDPESGVPFYVGKGQRKRDAEHGNDAMFAADEDQVEASRKIRRIRAIRDAGHEPEIWIVRHGMSSLNEDTSVEAGCIDLPRSLPIEAMTLGATSRTCQVASEDRSFRVAVVQIHGARS